MVAELQTLPPVTPHNRALFLRYVQCNENLYALIDSLTKDPIPNFPTPDLADLYDWLASPSITPYISAHRTHSAHLIKCLALAALEEVLTTTQDPIEKRRTAANIIRALNPRPPVRGVSDSQPRETANSTRNRAASPPTSTPTTPASPLPAAPLGTRDSALSTSRSSPLQTEIARQVQAMLADADADDDLDDDDDFEDEGDDEGDDNNGDDPSPSSPSGGGAAIRGGGGGGSVSTCLPTQPSPTHRAPSSAKPNDFSPTLSSSSPQRSLRLSGDSSSPARAPPPPDHIPLPK